MTKKKIDPSARINEALLEFAQDFRGTILTEETADKITMRILDTTLLAATQTAVTPDDIR